MNRVDPRNRYDDLIVRTSREELAPDDFKAHADSEAATIGWVVLGLIIDQSNRVLLIDQPWATDWKTPGGVPKPDESLAEGVVREVREETGVEITPVRPWSVDEYTFVNRETGETNGWTGVMFEATAESTDIDPDPGLDDERISDVRWFDGLPDEVFHPLTEKVYDRCMKNRSETVS